MEDRQGAISAPTNISPNHQKRACPEPVFRNHGARAKVSWSPRKRMYNYKARESLMEPAEALTPAAAEALWMSGNRGIRAQPLCTATGTPPAPIIGAGGVPVHNG